MDSLELTNFLLIIIVGMTFWAAFYLQKIRELLGNELFRQYKERRGIADNDA